MASLLIKNGRIWDGESFFHGDVLTNGTHIEKIEPCLNESADFVYNAAGKTVAPGLVDLHVHVKAGAAGGLGIQTEMGTLPFGVTAVNAAGSADGGKAIWDSFAVKNTIFAYTTIRDNHADLSNVQRYLDTYGDKVIGVKVYFDTTVSEVRDITPLKEACAYARQEGLKVMVHCSHSPTSMTEIVRTLAAGDIITHVFHGGENACCDNDFEAFKLARQKGVILDAGFAGHVHTDFKNFRESVKSGFLPDTISTDITRYSAYKRGGRYGMTACMSMAKAAGMSEEAIFKAVTVTPAAVLGKAGEWGSLKVGRVADIAVFDYTDEGFDLTDAAGNTLASDTGYRCTLTVCDGEIVFSY